MELSLQTFQGTCLVLAAQNRQETKPNPRGVECSVGASGEKEMEQLGWVDLKQVPGAETRGGGSSQRWWHQRWKSEDLLAAPPADG